MPTTSTPNSIVSEFDSNLAGVLDLLSFDETLCSLVISSLEKLKDSASQLVFQKKIENLISSFGAVHEARSLRPKFEAINNQCVVLLVSYFGSTLQELFLCYLRERLLSDAPYQMDSKEIKVTIYELRKLLKESGGLLPELVLESEAISFQDMRTIVEGFRKYFAIEVTRSCDMENILFAQAARHAIVHNGCVVDGKMVKQLRSANLRQIRPTIKVLEKICFTQDEVKLIAQSMKNFLKALTSHAVVESTFEISSPS